MKLKVWIYGGSFYSGSYTLDLYDPRLLASEQEVKIITINLIIITISMLMIMIMISEHEVRMITGKSPSSS